MSKLGHGTERMVARCIALNAQGGERRSSGKMMTTWRLKLLARATVEHTVIESDRSSKPVLLFARLRPDQGLAGLVKTERRTTSY